MSYTEMRMRVRIRKATRNYARGLVNLADLERMVVDICVRYGQEVA